MHPFGGKVDIGENPMAAVIREVREETGLEVDNVRLEAVLLEIQPVAGEPYNWLIFHFSADYVSGELLTTIEGEAIYLSEEELKAEKLFPSVALTIDTILDRTKGTLFATIEYGDDKQVIVRQDENLCAVEVS